MFMVKWIARFKENTPIATEKVDSTDLDAVVSTCRQRLEAMRARYAKDGLDGFTVCDERGVELRRWMDPASKGPRP